jgi:hypothetical protein
MSDLPPGRSLVGKVFHLPGLHSSGESLSREAAQSTGERKQIVTRGRQAHAQDVGILQLSAQHRTGRSPPIAALNYFSGAIVVFPICATNRAILPVLCRPLRVKG